MTHMHMSAAAQGNLTPLSRKFEALNRSQHFPKPLVELLSMIVAGMNDTDDFKAESKVRLDGMERLIRLPTEEVERARRSTVDKLNAIQQETESLQATLRATEFAVRNEIQLHLASLRHSIREFDELKSSVMDDVRTSMSEALNDFATESEQKVSEAVDKAQETIANIAVEFANVVAGRSIDDRMAQKVDSCLAELDAKTVSAKENLHRYQEAERIKLDLISDQMRNFFSQAFETINVEPLLECHRVHGSLQVLEARLRMLEGRPTQSTSGFFKGKKENPPKELSVVSDRDPYVVLFPEGRRLSPQRRPSISESLQQLDVSAAPLNNNTKSYSPTVSSAELEKINQELRDVRETIKVLFTMTETTVVDKLEDVNEAVTSLYYLLQLDHRTARRIFKAATVASDAILSPSKTGSSSLSPSPRRGFGLRAGTPFDTVEEAILYLSGSPFFGLLKQVGTPDLGIEVAESSIGNGVKVVSVKPGSPASDAGLKVGEVIVSVAQRPIWTPNEFYLCARLALNRNDLKGNPLQSTNLALATSSRPIVIVVR
jgi:hypothetical protein